MVKTYSGNVTFNGSDSQKRFSLRDLMVPVPTAFPLRIPQPRLLLEGGML